MRLTRTVHSTGPKPAPLYLITSLPNIVIPPRIYLSPLEPPSDLNPHYLHDLHSIIATVKNIRMFFLSKLAELYVLMPIRVF